MGFVNGNEIEDEDYYLEINICINVFDLNRLINNIDAEFFFFTFNFKSNSFIFTFKCNESGNIYINLYIFYQN